MLILKALGVFERWLAHRRAFWVIMAITAASIAPSLTAGFTGDDFIPISVQKGASIGLGSVPFDLFAFSGTVLDHERLRAEGVFAWWADTSMRMHFFRPLTSLTHAVDFALWPNHPAADHAQNVVWYLLLVGAV